MLGSRISQGPLRSNVPGAAFFGKEFVLFRSDYLLASESLARQVAHYEVIKNVHT